MLAALLSLTSTLAFAQTTAKSLGDLSEFDGNVGYFATGNTMAEPFTDQPDGLACVLTKNSATIPDGAVGQRASLLKAYLYYSGNVFAKANASGQADLSTIDRNVSLTLPGQTSPISLQPEIVYRAQFTDGLLSNRTSYFYTARADITDELKALGRFTGTYTFADLITPICLDPPDVFCDPTAASPPKCSASYFRATASFMIVTVWADPGLPPRAVKLFDGLEIIDQMTPSRTISLQGVKVSAIPKGTLTLYGLEGDALQTGDSATVAAGGRAAVPLGRVISPGPPAPTSLTCGDSSWPNWSENIFDSSTVTDPTQPQSGACTRGIDIDTYDISSVLQANDSTVDVNIYRTVSSNDVFGVAFAALGIDVFRPVLDVDSKKQVLFRTTSLVEPKTKITYRVGISNTGNIAATGVSVIDHMPASVRGLTILKTPPGSTDFSSPTGGNNLAGLVDVRNITVRPGDVFEVRYEVELQCPVNDGAAIINTATISDSAEGAKGTVLSAPALRVSDPGGEICAGTKNPGDTGTLEVPPLQIDRVLRGGGGCSETPLPWLIVLPGLLWLARRPRRMILLAVFLCTCRPFIPPPEDPPAPEEEPKATEDPKPVAPTGDPGPVPSCGGIDNMITLPGGTCIDRFEAIVESGAAVVRFGAVPTAGVSFFDAQAACVAGGKRLCTAAEWELGCRGNAQRLYPYGDTFVAKNCNGFDADWGEALEAGANTGCASDLGVIDMSGNLSEWVNADFPQVGGTVGKQLRGGSYVGNPAGLTCTQLYGATPTEADPRAGVRCCK